MDQLLQCCCSAGKLLLQSGAETYRVEETMVRICQAFGGEDVDSFALPTGIFFSYTINNQSYSKNIRVKNRNTDLNKIHLINELSRLSSEKKLTLDELTVKLEELEKKDDYTYVQQLFFAFVATLGFALFFQGTAMDAICSGICGVVIKIVVNIFKNASASSFFSNTFGGAACAFTAIILTSFFGDTSLNIIIISGLMLLVPGIAITTAIRDSIAGDMVSGMTRAVEAFLIAISIAIGAGVVLGVFRMFMEVL